MVKISSTMALIGLSSLSSAVVLPRAAPTTPPAPVGQFQLESLAKDGPYFNSGLFFVSYHTGAGYNAAVGTYDQKVGTTFLYNRTSHQIHARLAQYVYYLGFNGLEEGDIPEGYIPMSINVVDTGYKGFVFDKFFDVQVSDGAPSGFESFAVCHNKEITGISGTAGQQLFARATSTQAKQCSDVKLKAII